MPKDNLQIYQKNYERMFPFNLVYIYEKKGNFDNMLVKAACTFPELTRIPEESTDSSLAFVYAPESSGNIFFFMTDDFGLDILVHEITHIVFALFDRIQVNINEETEEFFAYISESLFRDSISVITKEFKLKMKMYIN